jgi:hypothetical protein
MFRVFSALLEKGESPILYDCSISRRRGHRHVNDTGVSVSLGVPGGAALIIVTPLMSVTVGLQGIPARKRPSRTAWSERPMTGRRRNRPRRRSPRRRPPRPRLRHRPSRRRHDSTPRRDSGPARNLADWPDARWRPAGGLRRFHSSIAAAAPAVQRRSIGGSAAAPSASAGLAVAALVGSADFDLIAAAGSVASTLAAVADRTIALAG